ncbi:hypothetical protein QUA13_09710 [Microcoleus sp. S28C3]|uniref:hypothetical protein n=1 Tax=Microcoleus sp. S28C3 TaxID=3055414 RepID=UPI002FD05D08
MGLNVGELIKISNLTYSELEKSVEVIVKSKSKVLKEEMVSVNETKFIIGIEYIVEPSFNGKEKSLISSDTDLFLMELVELAERHSISTYITLFVQGTVISGYLISEDSFFRLMKHILIDTVSIYPTLESIEKLLDTFRYFKNKHYHRQEQKEVIDREFIYLTSPTIIFGNSVIGTTTSGLWRGRLSRIDGFVLGDSKDNNLCELKDWQKSWNKDENDFNF